MPDLAMIDSDVDGKVMRYAPVKLTPAGIPVYDIQHGEAIVDGAQPRTLRWRRTSALFAVGHSNDHRAHALCP